LHPHWCSGSLKNEKKVIGFFRPAHSSRTSTMASPQPPKEHDGVLSTLNVLVQALDIAKDACGIPPAQIALGSASVLLTMIRVRFPVLCENEFLSHPSTGHDGQ
jgi:hypothetical protein